MTQPTLPEIKIYYGPNIYTNTKAIVAHFSLPEMENMQINGNSLRTRLHTLLPDLILQKLDPPDLLQSYDILLFFVELLLNSKYKTALSCAIETDENENKIIIIRHLNEMVAVYAINISFNLVHFLLSNQLTVPSNITNQFRGELSSLLKFTPGMSINEMQFAAIKLNVPYYILDYNFGMVLYGQGKNGRMFNHSSSEDNSNIGTILQNNKILTVNMLRNLRYPVPEQATVFTFEQCLTVAKKMGYPVVIKPPVGTKGTGITCNIRNEKKLKMAFQKAKKKSEVEVIVEKHIEGDDHRFTVIEGKINGISRKVIPYVVGDGQNTIEELIRIENSRRNKIDDPKLFFTTIDIDDDLLNVLKFDGFNINSVPESGEKVQLRDVGNLSQGGFPVLLTKEDVHPDNIKLVCDATRALRLDSTGVDFITPDISKSWRECGNIIEVNAHPMISERLATKLIENKFSERNIGRIDTVLIITNDRSYAQEKYSSVSAKSSHPSFCSTSHIDTEGALQNSTSESLQTKCIGSLMHPDCDLLVVSMSPDELIEFGLPLDRFDTYLIDENAICKNLSAEDQFKRKTGFSSLEKWLYQLHCGDN